MKKFQLFILFVLAAVMFTSCGDDGIYPITMTFEEITYGDIKAYENAAGDAVEIDAVAYEDDADLIFPADDILTSVRLLTETTAEFVDGTFAAPVTYTKDGDTFTFIRTSTVVTTSGTETSTIIAKGDENELKFDSQVLKATSADGSFDYIVASTCTISNQDGDFCGDPSNFFDTYYQDALIAITREATIVFTSAE